MNALRKSWAISYLAILAFGSLIIYQGCGGGGNSASSIVTNHSDIADFFVQKGDGDNPKLTKIDGSLINIEELKRMAVNSVKDQSEITFIVNDRGDNISTGRVGFQIGKYYCRMQRHRHDFNQATYADCLPKNQDLLHFNLEIKRNDVSPEIILGNIHLVVWWNNGPQFGVYVTWTGEDGKTKGDCRSTEGKFTAIKEAVKEALMEMELSESTSSIIAPVVAVIAFYALFVVVGGVAVAIAAPPEDEQQQSDDSQTTPSTSGGTDGSSGSAGTPTTPGSSGGSGGSGSTTPPPVDSSPPRITGANVTYFGNDRVNLEVWLEDSSSGIDWSQFWLQDRDYNWYPIGGKNYYQNHPIINHNMADACLGIWKFFVEVQDKAGNHLDRTDTGQRIAWGAPSVERHEMIGPGVTGASTYRVQFDSPAGHSGVDWSELFYWIGSRYYRIGERQSGWTAEWTINPLDYSLVQGAYPLTLVIQGTNGCKADHVAAGSYLSVPDLVIPAENLVVPFYIPSDFTKKQQGVEIIDTQIPNNPMHDRIPISVTIGGEGIEAVDHWCVLIFGHNGIANSYKDASGHQRARTINCTVDTYNLPSGKLTTGAAFYQNGNDRDGYIIHSYGRVWVDRDPPTFDRLISGPTNHVKLDLTQSDELSLITTLKDLGGSGTAGYRLALIGQGQRRNQKEELTRGYWGFTHFDLRNLPLGSYSLMLTYVTDRLGNENSADQETGISYELVYENRPPPLPLTDGPGGSDGSTTTTSSGSSITEPSAMGGFDDSDSTSPPSAPSGG